MSSGLEVREKKAGTQLPHVEEDIGVDLDVEGRLRDGDNELSRRRNSLIREQFW